MPKLSLGCLLIPVIFFLTGCAAPGSTSPGDIEDSQAVTDSDSLEAGQYDLMFVRQHGQLMTEIAKIEEPGRDDPLLVEIRIIVQTAEEFYLQGNPLLAIKLLTEAELLLRQTP